MARTNNNALIIGISAAILIAVLLFGSGTLSITEPIQRSYGDSHDTIDSAMAACADRRQAYDGTCDPCGLACPSGALDGTHDNNNDGTIDYTFDPDLCSDQYTATGNLLEVKSYCYDTIQLCEEQIGTGEITDTLSANNGEIREITYTSEIVYCDTGEPTGTGTSTEVVYQLECDSGYVLSGTRQASSTSLLGTCETEQFQEARQDAMAANFANTNIPGTVVDGELMRVTGTADVTGATGQYYIHIQTAQSTNEFSIISGTGVQDLCGNSAQASTLIRSAGDGDEIRFTLYLTPPALPSGTTEQEMAYELVLTTGCEATVLDREVGSFVVERPVEQTRETTSDPVATNLTEDPVDVGNRANNIAGQECEFTGQNQTHNGCVYATCSEDLTWQPVDPMVCTADDGSSYEVENPGRKDTSGNFVPTEKTVLQELWCWFIGLFGGVCSY